LRRAKPRDHVLALSIDQELAVKLLFPGGGIAGEYDAGRAPLAHIAEHHGLHGDRRAPIVGDVVEPPVGNSARIVPRAEHRGDRAPQLNVQILREGLAELLLHDRLEAGDELSPMLGTKLRVELETFETFVVLERLLEQIVVDAEHHVAIHLDEAAVGVVGKSAVPRAACETFDRLVVKAEIEHRVHHARHRRARARAHRHEQRIIDVAETGAGNLAHYAERFAHHRHQRLW
jgi:hypothetical protein